MKYYNHFFPQIFFCKLDERNSIRLLTLNLKENKYAYNINCKIILKPYNFKFKCFVPTKTKIYFKNFVDQYIVT
jgi:hypothetical protein